MQPQPDAPDAPAAVQASQAVQTLGGRSSFLSKSRYHSIEGVVATTTGDADATATIMRSICEIMKYDPEQNTYNQSHAKSMRDWRQRKRDETGKSFYETSGRKEKRLAAKLTARGAADPA